MKNSKIRHIFTNVDENRLEEELNRLKQKLGLGFELNVKWLPSKNEKLEGEVNGSCIYIYANNIDEAIKTLRHEFFDYLICKVLEPYKEIANRLIQFVNLELYKEKEKLVKALSQLCEETTEEKRGLYRSRPSKTEI